MKPSNTNISTASHSTIQSIGPVEIINLSHDGRGISNINGKVTFVQGGLPDEKVMLRYLKRHRQFDEAIATEILPPHHPHRTQPICTHFMNCGGCNLQHLDAEQQLQHKQAILAEQLQHYSGCQPQQWLPPLTGSNSGYRRKARLGVKYVAKKQELMIGFHEINGRYITNLSECPILYAQLGEKIPALKALIAQLSIYAAIPQLEVAIGDDATALIFRHLQTFSAADLVLLKDFAQSHQLRIYLQPGGLNSIHLLYPEQAPVLLHYNLPEYDLQMQFHPTDFIQVNAAVNQKMLQQALALLDLQTQDQVLDLFCGLGNFSLPIARTAAQVTGVEFSAEMVQRASLNAQHNGLSNAAFYQADLSSDVTSQAWFNSRYNKVLLDPPRTGALEVIRQLAKQPIEKLVYVSCNPATLARDAAELVQQQKFSLTSAGIMDMFTHTRHVEAVILFERKLGGKQP